MSVEAIESTARQCPSCAGPLEEMQTICAQCRAQMEAQVFAVTADSYVPPKPVARRKRAAGAVEADANAAIASGAGIDAAAKSADDSQETELLPLAPLEDEPPRRPARQEPRTGAEPRSAAGTAEVIPLAPASPPPPPPRTTPVIDTAPRLPKAAARPSASSGQSRANALSLQMSSRWKPIGIAIGALAVAAGLGVAIWAFIISGTPTDEDTTRPTVPARQSQSPPAPPATAPADPVEGAEVLAPAHQVGTVTLPSAAPATAPAAAPTPVPAPAAPLVHKPATQPAAAAQMVHKPVTQPAAPIKGSPATAPASRGRSARPMGSPAARPATAPHPAATPHPAAAP
jgi:hypothetical protein